MVARISLQVMHHNVERPRFNDIAKLIAKLDLGFRPQVAGKKSRNNSIQWLIAAEDCEGLGNIGPILDKVDFIHLWA